MKRVSLAVLEVLLVAAAAQAEPPPVARKPIAIRAAAVSPDGKQVLVGYEDDTDAAWAGQAPLLRLWDVENGKELIQFTGHRISVDYVAFLPDGKRALSGSWRDASFRQWDLCTGKQLYRVGGDKDVSIYGDLSRDGKRLITWQCNNMSGEGAVRVRDAGNGKLLREHKRDKEQVYAVRVAPDGKTAVLGSTLIDLAADRVIHSFEAGNDRWVAPRTFSPDGKLLLLERSNRSPERATAKARLVLWDVAQDKEVRHFTERREGAPPIPTEEGYAYAVAFAPDGKRVLTADSDNMLRVWDVEADQEA